MSGGPRDQRDKSGLNLQTELITYALSSATVRNQLGELLDEATLDVAETGE